MVDPAVEEDEVEDVLHQLPLLENLHRGNPDALGVDGVGVGSIGAGDSATHVVVVGDVGNIGHYLVLVKDGGGHGDVGQVGAAAVIGVVGDKHVSGMDLVGSKILFDLSDQAQQGAQVHGNMFGLSDGVAFRVEQRAGAVLALLDVGGICGLDQDCAHLLSDGHEGVSNDLQQDTVNFHASSPPFPSPKAFTIRLPWISTSNQVLGGMTVVESICSTMHGPSTRGQRPNLLLS